MVAYGIAPEVVPRAVILVIAGLALLLLVQELASGTAGLGSACTRGFRQCCSRSRR